MAAASAGVDQVIYVSPSGNDAWSGISLTASAPDGPVKSLPAAQRIARAKLAAMASSGARQPVRVLIAPGTYPLTAPLSLTQLDSGVATAPVSYEAITPGTVTISGGVTLTPRSLAGTGQPAIFDVPAAAVNTWNGGGQLFVNGRRATLARQPNAGQYYFVQRAVSLSTEPSGAQGRAAFIPSVDAMTWVNGLPSADRARAVVNLMQAWTSGQHHFANGAPANSLQVAPSANWPFLGSGTSQRYFVENVAQALDAPGEWYGDASGIKYLPATDESGVALSAVMPVLPKLVVINGDMNKQVWAQYISFKGLKFAYTRYLTPDTGFVDAQAAANVGAAIEVDNARFVTIDNCAITGVAGYGVWFRRNVTYSSVNNSNLTDLGAGGIQMGQQSMAPTDPMPTGHNTASGNRVGKTGLIFPGAVGIWVGQGYFNSVSNNLIYNTTYSGISAGWTWGYATTTSGNNNIANNLLSNIGSGMMSDMGGIYTVGISPGTTITGNVVREVRGYIPYGAGSWGIYQDGGSSQTVVSNNIVIGADNGTYQLTTGRKNVVQSNLFGLGDRTELSLSTSDPANTPLTVTRNLMIPKVALPFSGFTQSPDAAFSSNVISQAYAGSALNSSKCGAGCVTQAVNLSTTSDPRGVAVSGADSATVSQFSLIAANAGPTNLPNASTVVTVANKVPALAVAPPIPFTIDIADAALGSQPVGFWYSTKGTNAPTSIVANAAAPSGRCLRYLDSSSNFNSYDPHTYAAMNHASGTTTGAFYLLIDAGMNFAHQWRDNAVPTKTGPAISVTASGVSVGGKIVAPVTVGQWMKFSITARLATPASTWSLQVTDATGKTTTVSNLAFASAGWGSLNWWGFISNASTSTSFCLHSVSATNVP
jgi:Right handed beta helix region